MTTFQKRPRDEHGEVVEVIGPITRGPASSLFWGILCWFGFVVFLYHDLSDFNDIFCWLGFVVFWDMFCWFGFVMFTTLGSFTTLRAQNVPCWSGSGRGTWFVGKSRARSALCRASPGRRKCFAGQAQGAERSLLGKPRARNAPFSAPAGLTYVASSSRPDFVVKFFVDLRRNSFCDARRPLR